MRARVKLLRRRGVPRDDCDVANVAPIQGKLALSVRSSGSWSFQALDLLDQQLMGRSETVATLWEPRIMAVTPLGMRLMGFERSDQGYEGTAGVVQEWMVEIES